MRFLALTALACAGDKGTGDSAGTGDTGTPTTDTDPTVTTSTPDERVATIIATPGTASNGSQTYTTICSACHMPDGSGNETFGYPALAETVSTITHVQIVETVFYGAGNMDAYDFLTNREIADVVAYVEQEFGPPAAP